MFVAFLGCGARRDALTCPSDGPTKNDFLETKGYDSYEVEGDHPDNYLANARARRPFSPDAPDAHGVGFTESKFCLHWQMLYDASGCRIGAVRLHHLVRITLPKWKRPKDARADFVAWDQKTSAQLAQHEEGHYLIATAEARALYEKALAITAAPTCDTLDQQFDALLKTADVEHRRKQREYDETTQHGTASQ